DPSMLSRERNRPGQSSDRAASPFRAVPLFEPCGHWIGSRPFRDRRAFRCRELGLKLIGDLLRDFGLNGKYVCDIAIVMFSPKMRIAARVNQLRTHSNSPARALDTALDHMRNTQSFCDLAEVALGAALVFHHARPAD